MEDSTVFISDDLLHDAHAVAKMEDMYITRLQKTGLEFAHKVVYSDGCASQFKSKVPFYYIATTHSTQRSFFGTQHGKSPCDALGGVVKTAATRHIASRQGKYQSFDINT